MLGGKLELLLEAGEAAAGRALLPGQGGPAQGRCGLTFGTLSHFLLVAYPPLPAKPVAARVRDGGGWGVLRKETPRSAHTCSPSLQWKRDLLGFRVLPNPCVRFIGETLLLSIASEPAGETELYYVVTSS